MKRRRSARSPHVPWRANGKECAATAEILATGSPFARGLLEGDQGVAGRIERRGALLDLEHDDVCRQGSAGQAQPVLVPEDLLGLSGQRQRKKQDQRLHRPSGESCLRGRLACEPGIQPSSPSPSGFMIRLPPAGHPPSLPPREFSPVRARRHRPRRTPTSDASEQSVRTGHDAAPPRAEAQSNSGHRDC